MVHVKHIVFVRVSSLFQSFEWQVTPQCLFCNKFTYVVMETTDFNGLFDQIIQTFSVGSMT